MYVSVLEGFIKTNFCEIFNNKLNKIIGCGSITDGTYKLEVHILDFSDDNYFDFELKKGDKIEVIGSMQHGGKKYLYFNYFLLL